MAADVHPPDAWGLLKMAAPELDILRKERDGSFIWMEAAQDMQAARNRLAELVAVAPGEYFVFDQRTQEVVAKVASRAGNAQS